MVQASEAEKNYTGEMAVIAVAAHAAVVPLYAASCANSSSTIANQDTSQRLYVGSLHYSFSQADITRLFELMGHLEYVNMPTDKAGVSKGYCFIQYSDSHDARAAYDRMNGYDLGGMCMRAELVTDDSGHIYAEGTNRTSTDRSPTTCLVIRNVFDVAEYDPLAYIIQGN